MPFDIDNPPSITPPNSNTDFSQPQNQVIGNVSFIDRDPKPPATSVVYRDKLPLSKPQVVYVDEVTPPPTYGNIVFDKIIYSSNIFKQRISSEFSELNPFVNEEENLDAFFDFYNRIFYSIPSTGPNSHTTLLENSKNFLQNYVDPKDQIIFDLEKEISQLELENEELKNPQENPLFRNSTLISIGTQAYYMDKGYRRPVNYTQDFWRVLTSLVKEPVVEVTETILKSIPLGPDINESNFSDPFNPSETIASVGSILSRLDPADASLSPSNYSSKEEFRLALEKDLNEKTAVVKDLQSQITSVDQQIAALLNSANNISN
jgi:hypothetical protein